MANLKVNNHHNLRLRVNKDEYWDFFVNRDSYGMGRDLSSDGCLISSIDLNEATNEFIYSNPNYIWDKALSVGYTLYNITYVGVDNGLFTFRKDRISNKEFLQFFQSNKLVLLSDDYRLKLNAVSGNTLQYDYPLHKENGYVAFNGGFYQGFFETECDKYQILPSRFDDGDVLNLEFTLNKCDLEKESDKTLNDKYPNNKGIFFYIGTRAENKWIYLYDKEDKDDLESCDQLGIGDFVEGGEIDKDTYIIGNFDDLDAEYYDDPPLDIDDYTNFNYYDENLYKKDSCDWDDMFDYLELTPIEKPKVIDEDNNEYINMPSWCCNTNGTNTNDNYVLKPFFNGCGCPIKYKKIANNNTQYIDDEIFSGADAFGEGDYISGWDNLNGLEEDTTYVEKELDISDFEYYTDNGFNLKEANWYYFYTDNKFLMFDRTENGMTVDKWVEGTEFMYCGRKNNFKGNLFILMNRTKTGYTVSDIDRLREQDANDYNPYNDLYDNAFALRITDKGEIGYRLLTKDCNKEGRDKTKILEGYSYENIIPSCEWAMINVRVTFLGGDKMKLMFYVNGKLKYVTSELPRINLRQLNDIYDKQEGVPYNISIGGGTQGLAETIQYNYMLNPTRVYPLERYFGGTFIGYIKSFKMYDCLLDKEMIEYNYKANKEFLRDFLK